MPSWDFSPSWACGVCHAWSSVDWAVVVTVGVIVSEVVEETVLSCDGGSGGEGDGSSDNELVCRTST